jgi:hypothetical protein
MTSILDFPPASCKLEAAFTNDDSEGFLNLRDRQPLFIGTKMDGQIRRRLEAVTGTEKKYVSRDETTFLTICRLGEDEYVGKVIDDALTTDRVDDIRRNVLSILQRLCPETRFPATLDIYPCDPAPE